MELADKLFMGITQALMKSVEEGNGITFYPSLDRLSHWHLTLLGQFNDPQCQMVRVAMNVRLAPFEKSSEASHQKVGRIIRQTLHNMYPLIWPAAPNPTPRVTDELVV